MRSIVKGLQPVRKQISRSITATRRSTGRSIVLGLLLVTLSFATVLATANAAPSDSAHANAGPGAVEVKNVAPRFARNLTVETIHGKPGAVVIEGDVVDPDAGSFEVFVTWGDGPVAAWSLGEPCTVRRGRFTCEHTYAAPSTGKGYVAELTVKDDDGGVGKALTAIKVP